MHVVGITQNFCTLNQVVYKTVTGLRRTMWKCVHYVVPLLACPSISTAPFCVKVGIMLFHR